ncbi:MAG TPA: ribonuclease P protein component [Ktedonobacterales bacterium]|nr:ribonuclease P protein component [Ktedonobacterales bacterium]
MGWAVASDEATAAGATNGRAPSHPAAFGRARRLRTARDYAEVRRRGRAVSGALLTLVYAPAGVTTVQPATATRVGIVIGKRVGNAVTRNRVRRRVRERLRRAWLAVAPNWDLIIIGRPAAADASSADLWRELAELLRRARVLVAGTEVGSG